MKRTNLFLKTLLLLFVFSGTAWSQQYYAVSEAPLSSTDEIVSGEKYAIRGLHTERGGLWYENGNNIYLNNSSDKYVGEEYIFTIESGENGTFRIKANSGKYLPAVTGNSNFTLSSSPSDYIFEEYSGDNLDLYSSAGTFQLKGDISGGKYVNANYPPAILASWSNGHPTCIHKVIDIPSPTAGEFYYIASDNSLNGEDISYYLHDGGGTLSLSTTCEEGASAYIWKCVSDDGAYTFINGNGKYLAFRTLSSAPYKFTLTINDAINDGNIPLYANAAGRYMTVKNDGSGFGYDHRTSNKAVKDCSSDFRFTVAPEIEIPGAPVEGDDDDDEEAQPVFPEDGKSYYLYSHTYQNGAFVHRYFSNNSGTLTMSTTLDKSNSAYIWTAARTTDGYYTFANQAGSYLGHKGISGTAYNFTVSTDNVNHAGVTLYSVNASRYFVVKNDGTGFDQSTLTYDQTKTNYCTDFCFIEVDEPSDLPKITIVSDQPDANATFTWNGKNGTSFSLNEGETVVDAILKADEYNSIYRFDGFYSDATLTTPLGETTSIETLEQDITVYAKFVLDIFSDSYGQKWIRASLANNTGYSMNIPAAANYNGTAPYTHPGDLSDESEILCFVGTSESFKIYFKNSGNDLALATTSTSYGNGTATKLTAASEATSWHLIDKRNETPNGYCISPLGNSSYGLNSYGGVGNALKLYTNSDQGNGWQFGSVGNTPLKLIVSVSGTPYPVNTKVGSLALTFGGTTSTINVQTESSENIYYVPSNTKVTLRNNTASYRGYLFDSFEYGNETGLPEIVNVPVGDEGLTIKANFLVDASDKSQYLYYNAANGYPYRIPAIATAANGDIFAISDNRPCGSDIGYGEVDIKCRMSFDNGATWSDEFFIADGDGGSSGEVWKLGFGDAAIVADRERNEVLIMMVCGNTVCWNGNYIPNSTQSNPNRVARVRATLDESTGKWEFTAPEHVTETIYPLFVKNGTATVQSLFIGSGRICQSRIVKRGEYYRLYCSVWTKNEGNRVIYSDDFGTSWNILGTVDDRPATGGDEPKCEELPNGDVILSSRKSGGRYFNVFSYNDIENSDTGTWGTAVSSNDVGGLSVGGNSTNGEIMHLYVTDNTTGEDAEIMLQSIPTGSSRAEVGIFWRLLDKDTYTSNEFAKEWHKGLLVTPRGSAYSTMCLQKDGNIGFLYEEEPGGYCIVYEPISIEDITAGRYSVRNVNTGIDEITEGTTGASSDNLTYDLMGRQTANPTKGIYIRNGKKIFIK